MKTLCIIEDEAKTRALLRSIVTDTLSWIEVLGEANNVSSGLQLIAKHDPDIVLLDVEMPDGTGFQLLERLTEFRGKVVFVTAYDEYAIQALRAGALDYIEKPVNPDELIAALLRARKALSETPLQPAASPLEKIAIPTRTGLRYVSVQQILYVKADNVYSELHLHGQDRPIIVSRTLKEVEQTLGALGFVRVHRSYLVNQRMVIELGKTDGGYVVLKGGKHIQLSRQYKEPALRILQSIGHML